MSSRSHERRRRPVPAPCTCGFAGSQPISVLCFPLTEAFVHRACGRFQRPSGASRGCEKGKIIRNNLHSFKSTAPRFASGQLLFLGCGSHLSRRRCLPAGRSSASMRCALFAHLPPGLRAFDHGYHLQSA